MAYLALYPEHQEAIFKELQQVCGGAMPGESAVVALFKAST
jgi:hypothetical protein